MSAKKKPARDERWLAVYAAVFANLLNESEKEERPSRQRSFRECMMNAEFVADKEQQERKAVAK